MPEVVFLSRPNETTMLSRRHSDCKLIYNTWLSLQLLIQVWIRTAVSLCNPSKHVQGLHHRITSAASRFSVFIHKKVEFCCVNQHGHLLEKLYAVSLRITPAEQSSPRGSSTASHDWGQSVSASVLPAPQRVLSPLQSAWRISVFLIIKLTVTDYSV